MIHFLDLELPVCYQINVFICVIGAYSNPFQDVPFQGSFRMERVGYLFLTINVNRLMLIWYFLSKIDTFWYINIFQ